MQKGLLGSFLVLLRCAEPLPTTAKAPPPETTVTLPKQDAARLPPVTTSSATSPSAATVLDGGVPSTLPSQRGLCETLQDSISLLHQVREGRRFPQADLPDADLPRHFVRCSVSKQVLQCYTRFGANIAPETQTLGDDMHACLTGWTHVARTESMNRWGSKRAVVELVLLPDEGNFSLRVR